MTQLEKGHTTFATTVTARVPYAVGATSKITHRFVVCGALTKEHALQFVREYMLPRVGPALLAEATFEARTTRKAVHEVR